MSESIAVLRLNSGEELICNVTEISAKHYTVDDVAVLIPTESNNLGLAPFMAYCKAEPLVLKERDVMYIREPVEGLLKQYKNMFGKIFTPTKKIIL
jgi:ABC-type multidrug transport system permease subunit